MNKVTCLLVISVHGSTKFSSAALADEKTNYLEGAVGKLSYEESGYSFTPTIGRLIFGGKVADIVCFSKRISNNLNLVFPSNIMPNH